MGHRGRKEGEGGRAHPPPCSLVTEEEKKVSFFSERVSRSREIDGGGKKRVENKKIKFRR